MEIDSPPDVSPCQRVVQRLVQLGVPLGQFNQSPWGIVAFLRENKSMIPKLVSSALPTEEEVSKIRKISKKESGGGSVSSKMKDLYAESLLWIQWMMFESDPHDFLKEMAQETAGERAVCGAVWGQNDLAYRCRTCEHDPTCAICVPCFQNGNHEDHDYSIMYTGGGCCDCGDETAWKCEGFCSKHKGTNQIRPLSIELVNSVGPVLDTLLACWMDKMRLAEQLRHATAGDRDIDKVANEFSSAVVQMLLEFVNCSESLLSFIGRRMLGCSGLVNLLVRAERFLDKKVARKLHELLLKLLGDPVFKYEFAKVLIEYYPITVKELTEKSSDLMLEKYPLLSTFSVQIFTVPNLTPQLVHEVNLLGILLGCLTDLLISCVGEDGHLQASKWTNVYEITIRLVEDTRYVMSHSEVPIYVAKERPDISRAWLRLICLVQGMDPLRRATSMHIEEDNEDLHKPFVLGHYLGNVHTLFVGGAYSAFTSEETNFSVIQGLVADDHHCHEVERPSQESVARSKGTGIKSSLQHDQVNFDRASCPPIPSAATWLIIECVKTIESWLGPEFGQTNNSICLEATSRSGYNLWALRKKISRTRKGSIIRSNRSSTSLDGNQVHHPREGHEVLSSSSSSSVYGESEVLGQNNDQMDFYDMKDMYSGSWMGSVPDNSPMDIDSGMGFKTFNMFNLADWPDIDYDVKSQEISFHIPLHRLLSLLLRRALKFCFGETGKLDKGNCIFAFSSSRQDEFFGQVLKGLHPCGFSAYIMEHPLRLRVFCAQVHAGMWRKNGDTAILSCEWYRSVQWLEQGLESDLFLLQWCAALAPPELFIKSIQERFGLSSYTSLNLADHSEYEPVLVQEMLTLIIQIIKERRFCGLSTSENLRRELVYRLVIGDATHSQLVKALPRDLSKNRELRDTLEVIAAYSKPSGIKQGKYSLRKEFWKELDLYHPRWNPRDLQVAGERYLHVCKVSALNIQLPRWTAIFDPLSSISRIATSKAVLHIIRAVIFYAVFTEIPSTTRASDGVLIAALHLLSLGLDVCEKQLACDMQSSGVDMSCEVDELFPILTYASEEFDGGVADEVFWKNQSMLSLLVSLMRKYKSDNGYNDDETRQFNIPSLVEDILKKFAELSPTCVNNLKCLAPDVICHIPRHSSKTAIPNSASTSDMEERKAKARKHQAAIMKKMRDEQSKFIASLKSTANDEPDSTKSNPEASILAGDHVHGGSGPVCSLCREPDSENPLCFLVLLQKSRLTYFVERGPVSWEDVHQSDKEMSSIAMEEVTGLSGVDTSTPVQSAQYRSIQLVNNMEPAEADAVQDSFNRLLLDIWNTQQSNASCDNSTTSVAFETLENDVYQSVLEEIYGTKSRPDALTGEFGSSTQVADSLKNNKITESSVFSARAEFPVSKAFKLSSIYNGFGPRNCDGIHLSSCGHAVHKECHDRYLISLKQRRHHRLGFEGAHVVDPDLGELLCPVCRRFANSILPICTGFTKNASNQFVSSSEAPAKQVSFAPSNAVNKNLHLPRALSLLETSKKMVCNGKYQKAFRGKQSATIEPALEPALHKLCILYFSHSYNNLSASGRLSPSLVMWDTLRYSLVSTEIAARGRVKTCSDCSFSLDTLYGELHSSSGFILSLLLSVVQNVRSSSQRDVFLRFRGIQLLSQSICHGVSADTNCLLSDKQRGTLSSILEHVGKGEAFPDIQFCRRAADPILAHDPFSSLMCVLFCLPFQFLSSSEFFIPLVHLFYAVCVSQALITCHTRQNFDDSCFGDSVLNDILKTVGKFERAKEYFGSNYVDFSCNPKDMIRKFTFPYLRRCALLWKLLQSSMLVPVYDSSHAWECPMPSTNCSSLDSVDCLTLELNGVRELEDMFQIHSLESVLKDELVHRLALKWCEHFCEDFTVPNCSGALLSTPAFPFRLMQLPRIYQDLLQRYVKLKCTFCDSVPEEPALCLLCGSLCSPGWKPCCRPSRCLNHATVCGAGIGVFLLVRRTTILLQRSLRQAFWPSPYLDAFGEEDNDVSRGRPLYLSEERYASLTYLVASHGLDRTSEVLRQTTFGLNGSD